MFRKTEILLKINFKLATTVTVVAEYFKVIDIGPCPTLNSLLSKEKNKYYFTSSETQLNLYSLCKSYGN